MTTNVQRIHEPEAELLTLEETLEGAKATRDYLQRKRAKQVKQPLLAWNGLCADLGTAPSAEEIDAMRN